MSWRDFPLPDGSYSDTARPWAQQDVVNYLPVFATQPGARSRLKLRCAPGLYPFASIGNGPHRGAHDVEGTLFVVSGQTLYEVATDGTATSRGTIPGTDRVVMAHNQVASGNQLVIGNGLSGYVYDTAKQTFSQITDPGFPGFCSVDFLGQYILGVEPMRRYWFHSDLADATSYNTLNRYEAETQPDRIVGLIASHNEVLVFGERSIEPWVNDPTESAAFQLNPGTVIERGCASAQTICRLDNSVFFLGSDGIVYRLNGYTPVPISTLPQAAAWHGLDWSRAFAFTWEDAGHVVYYLTFPDGNTWGYDVAAQRWHRRESYTFNRWRINTLAKWGSKWVAGDFQTGRLHALTWGYTYEGCELMPRSVRFGVMHGNGNRMSVNGVKLLVDTGAAENVAPSLQAPSITGTLPTAYVGDAIDYTYTVTPAYPGQPVTLTVSGTLPPGLALASSGRITGTVTTAGTYAFTITPSSECATGTGLAQSVQVKPLTSQYLAVGAGGNLYTAQSLSSWTARSTGTTLDLLGIAYGANTYVVVGGTTTTQVLKSSTDLTTWTDRTPNISGVILTGVAFGAGLFVVVSNPTGSADGKITTSPDGVTWTARTIPAGCGPLMGIAYGNGLFIAVSITGKALTSTDGLTWTLRNAGTDLLAIAFDGTTFMAVGSGAETTTTTDGVTWTARSATGGANFSFLSVGGHNGVWIAGANGVAAYAGGYASSNSGAAWTRTDASTKVSQAACYVSDGTYLIGNDNGEVDASTDGNTWTTHTVLPGYAVKAIYGVQVRL